MIWIFKFNTRLIKHGDMVYVNKSEVIEHYGYGQVVHIDEDTFILQMEYGNTIVVNLEQAAMIRFSFINKENWESDKLVLKE